MIRHSSSCLRLLVRRGSLLSSNRPRFLSSADVPATPTPESAFVQAWNKVVPNLDPPKTPLSFMKSRPPVPSSIPSKLTVNFVLPYQSELSGKEVMVGGTYCDGSSYMTEAMDQMRGYGPTRGGYGRVYGNMDFEDVDMAIVPATTGQMGVLPRHVATIAELKPGVLSVHEGNDVTKYFVSSGFAFIHANSFADVVAVEAVPVDRIDPSLAQKGLADFQQKLNSASTDLEKAEAQIGIDVYSALNAALTG